VCVGGLAGAGCSISSVLLEPGVASPRLVAVLSDQLTDQVIGNRQSNDTKQAFTASDPCLNVVPRTFHRD
jgi:hypothetical protein